jgi:hypothetical protein
VEGWRSSRGLAEFGWWVGSVHAPVLSATCQPTPGPGPQWAREPLCLSLPFLYVQSFQEPQVVRWSRKIRWSVPTDKRVRQCATSERRARRTTEQGSEAISIGQTGEGKQSSPTFSRIRPKAAPYFAPVPSLQQVSAGWNLCSDFCGVVFFSR